MFDLGLVARDVRFLWLTALAQLAGTAANLFLPNKINTALSSRISLLPI